MTATGNAGRSQLGVRLVFGPLMLLVIGLVFWLDEAVLRPAGHPGVLSASVLGLLGLGAVHEFVVMMRGAGFAVASRSLFAATALLLASPFFFGWHVLDRELYPVVIGTLGLLVPIAILSLGRGNMARGLELQGGTLLGFLLIAWPMFFAQGMALRDLSALVWVVLVCKVGDIGGYLLGIAVGRRKLIPHISAGKTVEGAAGSLLASVLTALLLAGPLLRPDVPLGTLATIAVGVLLNVTTQTGDLVESLLKRRCGVKDSSALLPAHGGILDLVDSLLFSFPAFFVVLVAST